MSNDTNSKKLQIWESLKSKNYRLAFVSSHLATNIAAQIFSLREKMGWTQRDLARETGMAQARISLIENVTYDSFTVATLKRIAAAFDVMLIVRFVPYSEGVDWIANPNPEKLAPASYDQDSIHEEARARSPVEAFLVQPQQAPSSLENYVSSRTVNIPAWQLDQTDAPATQRYLQ